MRLFFFLSCLMMDCGLSLAANRPSQNVSNSRELRILLKELAYIGTDYPEAIRAGRVVKQEEYQEMLNFSSSAEQQFIAIKGSLSSKDQENIEIGLTKLRESIAKKVHHHDILEMTQKLTRKITLAFQVPLAPESSPQLSLGRHIYQSQCASCHGSSGKGDGFAGLKLEPPPRDFHVEALMEISSPFKFYNILLTGIEGTAMVSYADILTEDELWSTAFYLSGIRFETDFTASAIEKSDDAKKYWDTFTSKEKKIIKETQLNKSLLASSNDKDLLAWLKSKVPFYPEKNKAQWLAFLRFSAPYLPEIPLRSSDASSSDNSEAKVISGVKYTLERIKHARESFAHGDTHEAEQELLSAYLFGFEQTEYSLGLLDKSIISDVEQGFMAARSYAKAGDAALFDKATTALDTRINAGLEAFLSAQQLSNKSKWTDFIAAFVIIVREGFEAFLVVAALLALLSSVGETKAKRWVHFGWLSAIILGFASYYVFNMLIQLSGAAKETVEAVCTGAAVIMLFYTGFWLLSQAEHRKWNRFVKEKTQHALSSGRLFALFAIAFIAVYREAAETVLFYSALYSSSQNHLMVTLGFSFGCLVLFAICSGIVKFNLRLPLRQFFITTSCLMVAISIILAGKTVHELIEAGYFLSTPLAGFPAIDLLGIYPSVETLSAQLLLLMSGLFIAFFMLRGRDIASRT